MSRDFTLAKYAHLCETIEKLDCPVMTIRQFLEAGQPQKFVVVLRHDVDRQLARAIAMAELEAAYGFPSTYYFRTTQAVFRPTALKHLHKLGHEVGYHYEVLTKTWGNTEKAGSLFDRELKKFRQIVPVHTASMHGSPLMPWNNLDFWQAYCIQAYDLLGEAYLSIDYSNMYYFTDTGRSWNAGRYNLRDHTGSRQPQKIVQTTDDLMHFLTKSPNSPVFINTHPNRWTSNWSGWMLSMVSDWLINQVKWAVSMSRNQSTRRQ